MTLDKDNEEARVPAGGPMTVSTAAVASDATPAGASRLEVHE